MGAAPSSSDHTASSSSSASADHGASSSSNSNSFIYDVFLSFRGGDTRCGFTSHLYEALCNKGILAFRDDPKLRLGDEIRSTLLQAIERSGMSIVVLSEDYASSSWCLEELVKIIKCHKDEGRRVIPVFYHVAPSDVRHKKNRYGEAMKKHENGRNRDRVEAWRSALSAVADLSGKHCCSHSGSSESDIIKGIVEEVSKEVFREPLLIKLPVKHNPQLEVVKSLLDVGSHDTCCMLYIYGHDGIETTKFVVALYNKIFHEFEVACLVENVSTKSKKSATGIEELQKVLLSKIDRKEQHIVMCNRYEGMAAIKRRLHNKRALLILDDVDSVQQLESLAGGADWFGPGSRIIVTKGDEDVLDKHVLDGFDIKRYFIDECELAGMELAAESNKKRKWGAEEEEGDVVGFDDSLRDVIKLLTVTEGGDPSDHRNVVCITGMGGLGKTTLARKIFNNNDIKSLFPCRAWSCVSKDLNERKVLLDLLSCLKPPTSKYEDVRSEEELKEEVRKCLSRNKKFLVVLDDIWEPEVWDKVKDAFPNSNNEGMILITSRNNRVAYYTSPSRHHKLCSLKTEQSWELFCRKVFGREECPPHLEPIGKSIVDKCVGLPLAIVTIAGLVARMDRSNNREWSRVQECVTWYLAEDIEKQVMGVLKLSYDNLPEELKLCFLYFGVFPEDYEIVASRLIQLWIAEGFIQPEKTGTSKVPRLEVLADKYLDELVERNLVQVVKRRSYDGGVKTCRVHDLLRELCISESKVNNNNFLELCTDSNTNSLISSNSSCCRLSILNIERCPMLSSIKGSNQLSSTRSLFLFGKTSYADGIMKNLPMLYVLHVAGGVGLKKVPTDLKKMSHLKYLRMDPHNCLGDVLDCLWRLGNLETLDLRGWTSFKSSISIWKLERLRHIYMNEPVRLEGANRKPIMWNLQTLKRVLIEPQTVLLINSELFQNLISLSLMYHSPYSSWGELSPTIPPPPRIKPILLELNRLHNLRKLTIYFIKESLSSFDNIVFPPNISKITLRNIVKGQENNDFMSGLGRIPTLRVLKLDIVLTKGDDLNCGGAGDFPKLEVFHIKSFFDLTRLTIEDGSMPHLQHVLITDCDRLNGIPERLLPLCEIKSFRDRFK